MSKEKNILEGILKNRSDAQRQLLLEYGERVFAQIVRVVPSQEDAEEVYQDVFFKAFRGIGTYDAQRASLATWLLRIAYHESLNFMRGRKKGEVVHLEDLALEPGKILDADVDEMLGRMDDEAVYEMEQALELLSPDERSLIAMYYYEELSMKEIAYIIESVPSTVASRLYRIRQKLYHLIIINRNNGRNE